MLLRTGSDTSLAVASPYVLAGTGNLTWAGQAIRATVVLGSAIFMTEWPDALRPHLQELPRTAARPRPELPNYKSLPQRYSDTVGGGPFGPTHIIAL